MMFDLNDLRIFVAVADSGGISRAAEQLNYVQSNVTARIKHLEERLGVPLFNRVGRGVILSGSGKLLLGYAVRILALSGEAERALMEKDDPTGALVIGSLETTAAIRLPGILAEYHRTFSRVDLQVVTGMTEDLLGRVINYSVDAAFVAGEVDHPDLTAVPIFQDELVLATGKDSNIDDIRKRTLIVFRRSAWGARRGPRSRRARGSGRPGPGPRHDACA
jgi:DNA-binding transcriptional LysR family regulator